MNLLKHQKQENRIIAPLKEAMCTRCSINRLERKEVANQWRPNSDVQDKIAAIWDDFEKPYVQNKKLATLGSDLKAKIQAFSLPVPPTGKQDSLDSSGKKHLELAIKAVVEEYAEGLK